MDVKCAHCPTVHCCELLCRVLGYFCSNLPNPSAKAIPLLCSCHLLLLVLVSSLLFLSGVNTNLPSTAEVFCLDCNFCDAIHQVLAHRPLFANTAAC